LWHIKGAGGSSKTGDIGRGVREAATREGERSNIGGKKKTRPSFRGEKLGTERQIDLENKKKLNSQTEKKTGKVEGVHTMRGKLKGCSRKKKNENEDDAECVNDKVGNVQTCKRWVGPYEGVDEKKNHGKRKNVVNSR